MRLLIAASTVLLLVAAPAGAGLPAPLIPNDPGGESGFTGTSVRPAVPSAEFEVKVPLRLSTERWFIGGGGWEWSYRRVIFRRRGDSGEVE